MPMNQYGEIVRNTPPPRPNRSNNNRNNRNNGRGNHGFTSILIVLLILVVLYTAISETDGSGGSSSTSNNSSNQSANNSSESTGNYEEYIQTGTDYGIYKDGHGISSSDYVIGDSNSRRLTENDANRLTLRGINYAKNEIYARHGRMFVTPYIDKYFRQQSWYAPTIVPEEFSDSVFNEFESANIQLMVNEEARRDQGYSMEENPSSEFTNDELAEMALNCAGREFSFEAWIMEDTGDMVGILVGTPSPDGTGPTPHAYYYVNRAGVGEDTNSGEYVDLSGYQ